ncbi:MAG: Bax inhibitor-1/YccA family protein [Halieaceae bacterium]|jgi:modulator of FtsH protease|nr:Bax inhibitor-1/YccA family protein [Halieaceae bacterium]
MEQKSLYTAQSGGVESILETNRVLKNTYMLLSMTLLFSAMTAGLAMFLGLSYGVGMMMTLAAVGLIWFVLPRTANSTSGIYTVFAVTGLLGAGLGPILNHYLAMSNGPSIVMQAMGGTAIVFFGLSGYALTTRKDFSYMAGFLVVGLLLAIVAGIVNIFLGIPAVSLALSAAIVLIMSGFILFHTSAIINGGERNYIIATINLYMAIYNLFTSMLHLLAAFSGED